MSKCRRQNIMNITFGLKKTTWANFKPGFTFLSLVKSEYHTIKLLNGRQHMIICFMNSFYLIVSVLSYILFILQTVFTNQYHHQL